jgi:hypothetical protein
MLAMAQRRTKYKRKKKVPTVKFDDMQRTNKVNVDAAMRSFEGPTKATLAIASEIADTRSVRSITASRRWKICSVRDRWTKR